MNKRFIIGIVLSCLGTFSHAQVPAFESFAKDRGVTYGYVSRGILSHSDSIDFSSLGISPGLEGIIKKLDALQIIRSNGLRPSRRTEKAVRRIIQDGKYACVMQLDEKDREVTIYSGSRGDAAVLIMCTRDGPDYSVIVFSGSFTIDEVLALINRK